MAAGRNHVNRIGGDTLTCQQPIFCLSFAYPPAVLQSIFSISHLFQAGVPRIPVNGDLHHSFWNVFRTVFSIYVWLHTVSNVRPSITVTVVTDTWHGLNALSNRKPEGPPDGNLDFWGSAAYLLPIRSLSAGIAFKNIFLRQCFFETSFGWFGCLITTIPIAITIMTVILTDIWQI